MQAIELIAVCLFPLGIVSLAAPFWLLTAILATKRSRRSLNAGEVMWLSTWPTSVAALLNAMGVWEFESTSRYIALYGMVAFIASLLALLVRLVGTAVGALMYRSRAQRPAVRLLTEWLGLSLAPVYYLSLLTALTMAV